MIYHTLYLDYIILLGALVFPACFNALIPRGKKSGFISSMMINIGIYILLIALVCATATNGVFKFNWDMPLYYYPLAAIVGALVIGGEYLIGLVQIFIKTKEWGARAVVHSYYKNEKTLVSIFLILLLVILEEILFRQIFMGIFIDVFGFSVIISIGLAGTIYGLNHIYFGGETVIPKIFSGIILASLFYLSGGVILSTIIAHGVQNIALYFMYRYRKGESS